MTFDVTASIVLYRNNREILTQAIESFLRTKLRIRLYLVDNSPTDALRDICSDDRCEYIFNNANVGFGKGHNVGLRKSQVSAKYHIVLNPDVYFDEGLIENIFRWMEEHPEVGQLMPKILYPNGELQHSGKLLPTPMDLFGRRFLFFLPAVNTRNIVYELHRSGYNEIMNVPHHLGCFMFIRCEALKQSGLFDERIFMYTEDIDLTRRIHRHYQTVYNPFVHIYHHYEKGSRKKIKLLYYHITSAIRYFTKWGWIFDAERSRINRELINKYDKPFR